VKLSRSQREKISSVSVRTGDQRNVNSNWTPQHAAILEAAARDDAVDRIFVTAPVKIQLCQNAKRSDRKWLQKIRPFWGHHYHFHVRLACPKGARGCVDQAPPPPGDGCADAEKWVRDILNPPPPDPNAPKPKPRRQLTMADLPGQCVSVLQSR
jgi:penicillin-insensitive murein endopeptidase